MSIVAPASGIFGRHGELQRWFPGVDPVLAVRDRGWLERNFAVLEGSLGGALDRPPGERGTVWIRWCDGAWHVAHACLPRWSRDRSIPAWAVVRFEDQHFRVSACLRSAVRAVILGTSAGWSAEGPAIPEEPWDAAALGVVAELFDAALVREGSSGDGRYLLPDSDLDARGWLGLQAILVAMRDSGVESPCAAWCLEGVPPNSQLARIPEPSYVFDPRGTAGASVAARRDPVVRGVPLRAVAADLPSAVALVRDAASRMGPDTGTRFLDLCAGLVPLALVDASEIGPREWADWAHAVSVRLGSAERVAAFVGELVRRASADADLVGPVLALASAWVELSGLPAEAAEPRVLGWIDAVAGSSQSAA